MKTTITAATKRRRLAYLTNIPSPYRTDMIRAWARGNPDIAISVFYTDPDDQGRGWSTEPVGEEVAETRLPVLGSIRKYGKINRRLVRMVRTHDVVMIGGFEQVSYLITALLAKINGKPVILLFDGFSPARFGTEPAPVLLLKRLTAKLAAAFFANGTVGRRYLHEQIGVAAECPIHDQRLSHRAAPIEEARHLAVGVNRAQIRTRLGIADGGRRVIMTCGYLIARKRIDLIINAIAGLPEADRPLLLVVGSGELAGGLREQAKQMGVPAHFAGFKLGRDLAAYYFAADIFVLASSDDPWGLVINEAMAAGLPVLASDACGATLDLVRDGVNGYTFHSGDANDLRDAIIRLQGADLAAMGASSRSIIAGWTPVLSAENLRLSIEDALKTPLTGSSL